MYLNYSRIKSRTTSPAGGLLLALLDQCYFFPPEGGPTNHYPLLVTA